MTFVRGLRCVHCRARYPLAPMFEGCPACATDGFASGVTPEYDYDALRAMLGGRPVAEAGIGLWRYRRLLPVLDRSHEVSLGEGDTSLVPVPRLARELGAAEVWIKDESGNPTWSFKDRNAAVAVSKAREFGAETLVAATSGNHGASVAAYAARAGLDCAALTYPGISAGNRILMQASGAQLVVTTPEGRRTLLRHAIRTLGWHPLTNTTDPPTNSAYGHEGYKTIAYEIVDQLGGRPPDLVAIPTAHAEGLFGIWKGFDELRLLGQLTEVPRMLACEPEGGPLHLAHAKGHPGIAVVPRTATVARGIDVTANTYIGVAALAQSNGLVVQASDEAILTAQRDLATEGFFVEPASAAALAGLRVAVDRRQLPRGLSIVVVNTSSGLKNLEAIVPLHEQPVTVAPTLTALGPV